MTAADLTPPVVDLAGYYRGDVTTVTVRFWTDPEKTVPADLTDPPRTWRAQLRRDRNHGTPLAFEMNVDTDHEADGWVVLWLSEDDAAELVGSFVWDLEWRVTGGLGPKTVFTGSWPTKGDVAHG